MCESTNRLEGRRRRCEDTLMRADLKRRRRWSSRETSFLFV